MPEVPLTREHQRDAVLVSGRDHLVVVDRAAGLDDRADARRRARVEAVAEREERVAAGGTALGPTSGLVGRDPGRVDTVLLAGADADRLSAGNQHDAVRLHVTTDAPRQLEVAPLLGARRRRGDVPPLPP